MSWSADSKSDGGRVPSCTIFLILDDVTHAEFNELFYKNTFLVHFLVGTLPKLRTMCPFHLFHSNTIRK
jgi:hypothetical protein